MAVLRIELKPSDVHIQAKLQTQESPQKLKEAQKRDVFLAKAHLQWRHLLSPPVDQLLDAACQRDVAICIQEALVACVEPATCR